jgi:5-(carboxyamino)imidazole ribonucleotide synthase
MKVGILGGGQLARMIALAGYPLGIRFIFLDPSIGACATTLGSHLHGDYQDETLLAELAKRADVVTYEFENVPAKVASFLESHTQVYPPAKALAVAQDRLVEKNFLNDLGIPTAPYADITTFEILQTAMEKIGYPAILKTRTQGYDGKGQSVLKSASDLKLAWEKLEGLPAIVEGFVTFLREISIVAVRSVSGELAFYPLSENVHRGGILRVSDSCENDPMQAKAEDYATRLMKALDYVGVLALELFEVDGELVANEFAPRVHNSGHWTIEGAETSQFENHLRAILDLPLGSTTAVGHVAMVNFIGGKPESEDVLKIPNTHLHLYAKAPRKGRKIAHATIRTKTLEELQPLKKRLITLADEADDS